MSAECRRNMDQRRRLKAMSRRYNDAFDMYSEERFRSFTRRMDVLADEIRESGKACRESRLRGRRK